MNGIRTKLGFATGRVYRCAVRLGLALVGSAALVALIAGTAGAAPIAPGKPAAGIAGTTLDGKRLSLSALRGKPVVVNVWSSW